jgi:hypothetical protein
MNTHRDLRRQELLTQRELLKKRVKCVRALREARQYFDQCNLTAFEKALNDVEEQLSSASNDRPSKQIARRLWA